MSKKNFWKRLFKVVVPILFIGVAIEIWLYAPKQIGTNTDSKDKSELVKSTQVDQETEQVMEGVHLVELRLGEKEWELWANKAYSLKESGQLILEDVKVKIFGKEEVFYFITGTKGEVEINSKDILISGDVVMETSNFYHLTTDRILYKSEPRTLECPNQVFVTGPSEKQDEGPLKMTGHGMLTQIETNEIQLLEDVRAEKDLKNKSKFKLVSRTAKFKGTDYSARFEDNVKMDFDKSRVTGEIAQLDINPQTKQAYSATVFGNVRLTDIQRWAVAQEAQMIFQEKKFILRGTPKVVQDQDEIRGEEIIFFNEGKNIQIRKAKAKFEKTSTKGF